VLIGGLLVLQAAASAGPGSPLYGLHRLEENARVLLAGSDADRARLHLAYAREALDALDTAVAHQASASTYGTALGTFQAELHAAASALDRVPPGSAHDAIAAQLAALTERGRQDLRAALPAIEWPERIATSSVLGRLGATVPTVSSAQVEIDAHGESAQWHITLQGTDFQAGAILLVNGQPAEEGQVTSTQVTSTTHLEATVNARPGVSLSALGIGNPDDTAAATTQIHVTVTQGGHGHPATPTPAVTPTPTSNGGGHGKPPTPTASPGGGR
jgi:hypothetical protein